MANGVKEKRDKKEIKRVKDIVEFFLKKLDVKYAIGVYSSGEKSGEERTVDEEDAILEVCRSNRGQQDKSAFLVFVNTEETESMSLNVLKRHVFHEICHILTWEYTDEMENYLKYIEDGPLKEELIDRLYNIREDITYRMERTFGPFVLPTLDWTTF
jgi:hypothetical protein